jgi:serine/threonine-protein kinase
MRISPDGSRVALTILADVTPGQTGAGQDIWLWDIARGGLTRLSFTLRAASPVWTPDSRRVCFNSASDVICQPADGSGQSQLMFRVNGLIDLAQVSPDGKWLIMEVRTPEGDDIAIAALQPGAPVRPLIASAATNERPSLSPDGRWIAYESNDSGSNQVYVRPFPEVNHGRWQVSTSGGGKPHWSRNGRELFFLDIATSGASVPTAVMSMPVLAGGRFMPAAPKAAMKLPANAGLGFDEGADGRFLFLVPATASDDASTSGPRIVVVQNWTEELERLLSSSK